MKGTLEHPINLGIAGDWVAQIEYKYSPGTPDRWYMPNGDPGYPGDPAEVSITAIRIKPDLEHFKGNWQELDGELLSYLEEALELDCDVMTLIDQYVAEENAEQADAEYEAWRDRQLYQEVD